MKLKIILPALLVSCLVLLSGCISAAQMEGKIPRIDAKTLTVELNTVWGATAKLTETDVKWEGDSKTIGSSELEITSPAGRYKRVITGARIGQPAPAP